MMFKQTIRLACLAMVALVGTHLAHAYNPAIYAPTSKLATGKWVKITIPESGMYEITYEELSQMGFSNPAQVKLYGNGGNKISEVFTPSPYDDLKRVPILRKNNKICFYGRGPVYYTISNYSTAPHFTRVFNPYSQVGCYFLTEEAGTDTKPMVKNSVELTDYVNMSTSYNFFFHEKEEVTISNSGKEMLGEEFTHGKLMIDYFLPNIADSNVVVHTAIGSNANWKGYVNGVLHTSLGSDTTVYASSSTIYPPGDYMYYNYVNPYAWLKLNHPADQGQFEPLVLYPSSDGVSDALSVMLSYLDFFSITYTRDNVFHAGDDNQFLMGYVRTSGNERFLLPNASRNVVVWNIDNSNSPMEVITSPYTAQGTSGLSFTSPAASLSYYIAFDPTKTLKKISSYENVENQDLHGLPTPNMLIITTKLYHEQANRLADMHRAVDGMNVVVVDQEQVFNEFSSGTRDAMAYRLMCKMFYDRDTNKDIFKHLLLFGTGSFDNREILGEHPNNLLTYESDNSNSKNSSFTCDDFFGFLDDGSGLTPSIEKLRIGVGRITCSDVNQARSDVDKIVEYYTTPDYGVWRNNALVITDAPDTATYMFEGEGYKNMIEIDHQTNMHVSTVHNTMYPRSNADLTKSVSRREATEAKQQMAQFLKEGMNFATYVGHSGPMMFTKVNNMWTTADVSSNSYPHWPIMSTACCDVAHFDNDTHGIAELMFHKRNGGAIALLTSCRMVATTSNDMLNQYFINGLFDTDDTDGVTTFGEAYMKSKLGFESYNENKLSFFLLGDPALKFRIPVSRFNITKINGTTMVDTLSLATINPLTQFEVEARVVDANGNLDTSFNGDATLTLYDKNELFANVRHLVNSVMVYRDIYFNRPKLAEVTGRVTNGIFRGSIVAPRQVLAQNENVLLRSYAHKDNTDYMVNGSTTQIKMLAYDEDLAIQDNTAPVVSAMYVNNEGTFADGASVGTSAMIYITATDDNAINVQENQRLHTMSLILDGGKTSCADVDCYMTVDDNGKRVNISYPLDNLMVGMHTLTYTVYDVAGNKATHTITFMVEDAGNATLVADKWPAYRGEEVNFDLDNDLGDSPEMIIRVTDATGKLVWRTTTSSFPVTWNMKDMNGNTVPAGLYRYFGSYKNGTNFGGTPINKLIVLDALKTAH